MMKRPPYPKVSDHAVLRYIERAQGVDIAAIRRRIARQVSRAVVLEGSAVIVDGVKFVLREDRVVTTLKSGMLTHEAKRDA